MNPPFSLVIPFLERCFERQFRKIIMFQRFAFWESRKRRHFWQDNPPNRIYICGDRADCWRHDLPTEERGSGTPTAHAWFVFERGHPPATLVGISTRTLRDRFSRAAEIRQRLAKAMA